MTDTYRGHNIQIRDGVWVYSDINSSVKDDVFRDCGKCGKSQTKDGHDSCLGTLNYVKNACCGHGLIRQSYIQFTNNFRISGILAILVMIIIKRLSK